MRNENPFNSEAALALEIAARRERARFVAAGLRAALRWLGRPFAGVPTRA
jgi:hypothetical protein